METNEDQDPRSAPLRRQMQHGGRFWSTEETNFLIGMYDKNVHNIGPDKIFHSKLHLWNEIALRLNKAFHLNRTPIQCIRRFKTFQWNSTSKGKSNCSKSTESTETITSSADEEDPVGKKNTKTHGKNLLRKANNLAIVDVIRSTLLEIHDLKEEAKERRHRERMHLLEQFLKRKKTAQMTPSNDNSSIQKAASTAPVMQPSVSSTQMMRDRLIEMQRKKMEDRERKKFR